MAIPQTTDAYLREILNRQQAAAQNQYNAYKINADQNLKNAASAYRASNKSASKDYMDSINPYGASAEALYNTGLLRSGVNQKNLANTYNTYQDLLGQSAGTYAGSVASANADLLARQYERDAAYSTALSDYAKNAYADYWQLLQMEYQKQRDKVADEQYDKTFKLQQKYS